MVSSRTGPPGLQSQDNADIDEEGQNIAPAYLRGYREGFQLVLRDLRKLEQRG